MLAANCRGFTKGTGTNRKKRRAAVKKGDTRKEIAAPAGGKNEIYTGEKIEKREGRKRKKGRTTDLRNHSRLVDFW